MCVCLCSIHSEEELAAVELQIREFGQTPRRLFVLPHPSRLTALAQSAPMGGFGEEEVRTVGATTEGLGRMDSSSSWGQSPVGTPGREDQEWVYVNYQGEESVGGEAREHDGEEPAALHSLKHGESDYSLTLRHMQKVHKE